MKKIFLLLSFFSVFISYAQVGGEAAYNFLNLPSSARQIALGGAANTIEGDVNMPMWNPAMINSKIADKIAFSYTSYLSGISLNALSFVTKINEKIGYIYGGVLYNNYGSAPRADAAGNIEGQFKVYDLALMAGYAYTSQESNITIGGNVKVINSSIDTYGSFGFAIDFSAVYRHSNERTLYSFVIRNIGTQLKAYDGIKQEIPMQINFGVSSKLEHLPLQWYVTMENMQQWDVSVPNPSNQEIDIEGNVIAEDISFLDNAIRHLVVGAELFPAKKISIRGGYNFRKSKELSIGETYNSGGFSYGLGLNLKRIKFNYSLSKFNPNSNSSTFSLVINLY